MCNLNVVCVVYETHSVIILLHIIYHHCGWIWLIYLIDRLLVCFSVCMYVCVCMCACVCAFLLHCKSSKKETFVQTHSLVYWFICSLDAYCDFKFWIYVCLYYYFFSFLFCYFCNFVFVEIRKLMMNSLESEEQQEWHHETEKTHGFGQSESQDGIGEKLLFKWWISGIADDERSEHCSNTSTWTSTTNSGGTSTNEFGSWINVASDGCGLEWPHLWEKGHWSCVLSG